MAGEIRADIAEEAKRNTRLRFEQWAKNPSCEANTLSAVGNIRIDKIAESLGITSMSGQSPFAFARGLQFEAFLFKEEAKVLRSALVRAQALPENTKGFLDLRLQINGGKKIKSVNQALLESSKFLEKLISGDKFDCPTIVAGLMLRIPKGVMLPEATLIVDVLTVLPDTKGWKLKVGEIKVFPDRGGHTDSSEIASARAQAGVYRHALDLTTKSLTSSKSRLKIEPNGFLVFTWPGTNSPVIRKDEDLTYQALRAEEGFNRLDEAAQRIVKEAGKEIDFSEGSELVLHSRKDYKEACWSFCDLASRCHDQAIEEDRAIILGNQAAKALGGVTVNRTIALLDGANPQNEVEKSLQEYLALGNWEVN